MKHVYMSLSITLYRYSEPDCTFWEKIDDGVMTHRKLSLEDALRMQWELKKAGATRQFRPNIFDNAMSHVDVDYFARC